MIAFNTLGAESDYLKWIAEHPAGFVVNCYRPNPTPSYMVLHLATCLTIGPKRARDGGFTGRDYQKVCFERRADADRWASGYGGVARPCGICEPT